MAVQEINNSGETLDRYDQLLETGDLSDIEIKVGNRKFQTHRLVLCTASDVLKTMLMSEFWPEGRSKRVVLREDPECAAIFEVFLHYLYTGKVTLDQTNVLPMLILADKYNVSHLSKSCLQYMCLNCCDMRVISWLHYAVICGYRELEDRCSMFISNNFNSVVISNEFLNLDKEKLIQFLKSSDLVVNSEYLLYTCVKKWINNAVSGGEQEDVLFHDLIKHIRFPMMSMQELLMLEKDPLMNNYKDVFLTNMFVSLRHHTGAAVQLPQKFLQALEMQKQFIPRIYLTEKWSTDMYLEKVSKIKGHQVRGAFFSTPVSCSYSDESNHQDWHVMFYPKGVKYEPCIYIGVPHNLLNPGGVFEIVRLAFCTNCEKQTRYKISVLVLGQPTRLAGGDYVYSSITKDAIFDKDCTRFNLENVIPFDEVTKQLSPYKAKPDTLHLKIVIRPVSVGLNISK